MSLDSVTVTNASGDVFGIDASGAFSIVDDEILFTPGTLFDPLDHNDTATVVANYTMNDDHGEPSSSALTLTLNGENDAPVAHGDIVLTNVPQGTPFVIPAFALLANDTDAESHPLSLGDVKSNGQVSLVDGNVLHTNNPAQGGDFEYAAFDGMSLSADEKVSVETQPGMTVTGTDASEILIANNAAASVNMLNAGGGNDFVFGNGGSDILHGDDGNDFLSGGAGDLDEIYGDAGNDVLNGGAGFDVLYGGSGDDTLNGGGGDDFLFGEAGMDIFKFDALPERGALGDAILDFSTVEGDKLDLHDLLQTFAGYDGMNAFTGGYLNFFGNLDGNTVVEVDSDGTGGVDSFHTLATLFGTPADSIDAGDFIL
jgi:Ca2+-binding RTX toxin-like protein